MQTTRSTAGRFNSTRRFLLPFFAFIALLPVAFTAAVGAAGEPPVKTVMSDPLRYQGGVRNSPGARRLNAKQQTLTLKSLREKTGLVELAFDEDGFLRPGDPQHLVGGSATARELLLSAIESEHSFDLEAHPRSAEIAFARLGAPISFQSRMTGAQIDVVPVELDFIDFDRLRGDREAVASFDLALVILHELAHGVLRLADVRTESDPLGECEAHINKIRRELNLPERQHYFARLLERAGGSGGSNRHQAELLFAHPATGAGKSKREQYLLSWEALQVGQIRSGEALARTRGALASAQ